MVFKVAINTIIALKRNLKIPCNYKPGPIEFHFRWSRICIIVSLKQNNNIKTISVFTSYALKLASLLLYAVSLILFVVTIFNFIFKSSLKLPLHKLENAMEFIIVGKYKNKTVLWQNGTRDLLDVRNVALPTTRGHWSWAFCSGDIVPVIIALQSDETILKSSQRECAQDVPLKFILRNSAWEDFILSTKLFSFSFWIMANMWVCLSSGSVTWNSREPPTRFFFKVRKRWFWLFFSNFVKSLP